MDTRPLAVVAFGGNALLQPGDHGTQEEQFGRARQASRWLVTIVREGYDLLIVHGNGPQVGNLLIQAEEASTKIPPQTLDVAVAQTEGSIGFMLQQSIRSQLERSRLPSDVATLLTEVEVDLDDPAFRNPSKPIGPFFSKYRAEALSRDFGWTVREDAGRGWRKVVPSPRPISVLGEDLLHKVIRSARVTIAGGGGGIPVFRGRDRTWRGVEAVIDKDMTASLLATRLAAALFIIITGVEAVAIDYGKPEERRIRSMAPAHARSFLSEGQFPSGSMGPKIEAAIEYVEQTGNDVLISDIDNLERALDGATGTRLAPGELSFWEGGEA